MRPFGEVQTPLTEARIVVLPAPYDLSLSFRPGARNGPGAILAASQELELFNFELLLEPAKVGIHAAEEVPWVAGDAAASHALIFEAAKEHLDKGKFVVALGGDHSISYPLIQAHQAYSEPFTVLQIDAHTDLYPQWQGSIYSHASPMHRLVMDGVRLVQVGLRAVSEDSYQLMRERGIPHFAAHTLHTRGFDHQAIVDALSERVYISFDFDALDPAVMPAVGTPLPGGLGYREALDLLASVFGARQVVGMDFVELSPCGQFHAEMTAAQLIYHAIGLKALQADWLGPIS